MTVHQDPPVVEWLRGKSAMYRRAATTAARGGNTEQALVYRTVATQLDDVITDIGAYLAEDPR